MEEQLDQQTEPLFEMPVEFELAKSEEGERRGVKGHGTTGDEDIHGEELLLKGLDYAPLQEQGYINYDHQKREIAGAKVPIIIGYPTLVEMRKSGLWIEGELLNGDPMASEQNRLANEMWELGMQLKKSGANRRLAYSIEGGIRERRGKKLVRTVATQVALTHKPVNPNCTVELFAKSFCCGKCSPSHPEFNPAHRCGNKDVDAGEAMPELQGGLEKAATTGGYGALLKQNLDRGLSSVLYGDTDCDCFDRETGRFYKSLAGAYHHLTDCRGFSRDDSHRLLELLVKGAAKNADFAALAKTAGLVRQ